MIGTPPKIAGGRQSEFCLTLSGAATILASRPSTKPFTLRFELIMGGAVERQVLGRVRPALCPRHSVVELEGDVLGRFVVAGFDRRVRIGSDENGPIARAASED